MIIILFQPEVGIVRLIKTIPRNCCCYWGSWLSCPVLCMNLLLNAIALCHCVEIEVRWNKCMVASGSPEVAVTYQHNSVMKSRPSLLMGLYSYWNEIAGCGQVCIFRDFPSSDTPPDYYN